MSKIVSIECRECYSEMQEKFGGRESWYCPNCGNTLVKSDYSDAELLHNGATLDIDGEHLKEELVYMDGLTIDGTNIRALVVQNRVWNGWKIPYIFADDCQRVIDAANKESDGVNVGTFSWHTTFHNVVCIEETLDDGNYIIEPKTIDGESFYGIGAESWMWTTDDNNG